MNQLNASGLKFFLIVSLAFITLSLTGITLHEIVRKVTGEAIGYRCTYNSGLGQLLFYNEEMQSDILRIRQANENAIKANQYFQEKSKWDQLLQKDRKDKAMIELFGLIFSVFFSLSGLLLLAFRRKAKDNFGLLDWVGLMLSMFVAKEAVMSFVRLYSGRILCDHAKLAEQFGFQVFGFEGFILAVSIFFVVFMLLFYVPGKKLLLFLLGGLTGGLTGILLWIRFMGELLF
ncbi:MAG TPA: hypothetical protein PLP88_03000 [Bacteroidales bacterium]|nr:hypothetical protein [Bacteroidales bacterium]